MSSKPSLSCWENSRFQQRINCEVVFESCIRHENGHEFSTCAITRCLFSYPLRLMVPSHASLSPCRWVYPVNYGGGLVEGDDVEITVKVGLKCSVLWTSQSFQKVYKCQNGKPCRQYIHYTVDKDSLLAVLPDPVLCYKGAIFSQKQTVHMENGSNLLILDWFTSGRVARGESWEFSRYQSTVSIYMEEDLILYENVDISDTPLLSIKDSMSNNTILGVCILIGPFLNELSEQLITWLGKRDDCGQRPKRDCIFAVGPIPKPIKRTSQIPGCIIRFACEKTNEAYEKLVDLLKPLFSTLGGNPFETKY